MQIERIHLPHLFNPDNIVDDPDIFTRETLNLETSDGHQEQKRFSDRGIFSKRIFGDMDSLEEYSCDCGKMTGKFYENCMCDKCGTTVQFVGMSIDRYGWIDCSLATYKNGVAETTNPLGFHLIKYVSYMFLEKLIGKDKLREIIHVTDKITISGNIDTSETEERRKMSPADKYYGIGIEEFYKNYNEILNYFYEVIGNKKETEIYESLKDRDTVFTDKIPVLSIVLRPAMRTADGLKLDEINIYYQAILKNIKLMKAPTSIKLINDALIEDIQSQYFMLSEKIIDAIKSKEGLIRNQICGTRINFSARNIISPGSKDLKMDEIEVPYQTFLELYKFEIIKILSDIGGKSLKEAEQEWFEATLNFDEKVWMIMTKIVKENEVGCLLNRNPTIAVGSILYVKIKEIKHDFADSTMSVSNLVLSLLGGDYDGDVLNLISVKDKTTRQLLKSVFSPINLIIDPSNGDFNNSLNLERDEVLGLNALLS